MNEHIVIVALCIIGYIIIASFSAGLYDKKSEDNLGIVVGIFWPLCVCALIIMAIGYFPYKLSIGDFKKKNKCMK